MKRLDICVIGALLVLLANGGTTLAATQTVTATATVAPILQFTVTEAPSVSLGSISPTHTTAEATGHISILTTAPFWMLFVTESAPGDGHMKGGGRSLAAWFKIASNGVLRDLPLFGSFSPMQAGGPGSYDYTTTYHQDFTSGDYAGAYSISMTWVASAYF